MCSIPENGMFKRQKNVDDRGRRLIPNYIMASFMTTINSHGTLPLKKFLQNLAKTHFVHVN
jgi:hypothetical protein